MTEVSTLETRTFGKSWLFYTSTVTAEMADHDYLARNVHILDLHNAKRSNLP